MIRVGFLLTLSKEWMGGVNYYKNLFYALSNYCKDDIEIYIFTSNNSDKELMSLIEPYVSKVIYTSLLDTKNFKRLIWKSFSKYLNSNIIIENFLQNYKIDVVSHTSVKNLKTIKTISWIPDFQHRHLPQMFSKQDIKIRNKSFLSTIKNSDLTIVSSNDAKKDLIEFTPKYKDKSRVLQFVSQPENISGLLSKDEILNKYKLRKGFFYIPNQFWKHKNHLLVFKAAKILKDKNFNLQIVCTGHLNDNRNKDYISELTDFRKENNLEEDVILLGLIPYKDVFALMNNSLAVINPSLFEGWSSTVEECKSLNKNMILSNINIHKEQYPEATFFNSTSEKDLAKTIEYYITKNCVTLSVEKRTEKYASDYLNIVREVLNAENTLALPDFVG